MKYLRETHDLTQNNVCFLGFLFKFFHIVQGTIDQLHLGVLACNLGPLVTISDETREFPFWMGTSDFVKRVPANVACTSIFTKENIYRAQSSLTSSASATRIILSAIESIHTL